MFVERHSNAVQIRLMGLVSIIRNASRDAGNYFDFGTDSTPDKIYPQQLGNWKKIIYVYRAVLLFVFKA